MPVKYPTDVNEPSLSVNNLTQYYIDKEVLLGSSEINTLQGEGIGSLYPTSTLWGGDDFYDTGHTTNTIGDFALGCNRLMTLIWNISAQVPGIYNTMSSGAAPSNASTTSTSATEVKYITQLLSIKFNDAKRKIGRLEYLLARMNENITGALNPPVAGPYGVSSLYPSSQNDGY